MEENNEANNGPTYYMVEQPTVSDQLIAGAIGIGVTLAGTGLMIGAAYAIDRIGTAISERKARKALAKAEKEFLADEE